MDALEQIRLTFFQECEDLLAQLEAGLLAMQEGDRDPETINAIFRAVHSVKGGAGAFGLDELVGFAHVFETALDELRAGKITASEPMVAVFLRAGDVLADLVAAAQGRAIVDSVRKQAEIEELEALIAGKAHTAVAEDVAAPSVAPDEFGFVPLMVSFAPLAIPVEEPKPRRWIIDLKPHDSLYAKANDPVRLLRELARLGPCRAAIDIGRLPDLLSMEAEKAYASWAIELDSDCSEQAIREVFEFVDGDCDLAIRSNEQPGHVESQHEPAPVQKVDVASPILATSPPENEKRAAEPPPAASASDAAKGPQASATIRVDLERIDRLINLVGELVINQAMLAQRAGEHGYSTVQGIGSGLDELEQLTREIQDSVMAIRAQPVKSVFQRMPRLVRELALTTGKQVRLITEGETTEVDKTVIEQLSDPITHMIRNAIDHGLEKPERRREAGKPEEGSVRLAAVHRSGRIVIEVSDDGAGINRPRVRKIAEQRGLISTDAQLSDDEVDNLIFLPGFSTAQEVSNISGRGVGMDVVKRSVQALGGRISISSNPGRGSCFTMSLPLTLAVLDGMVVSSASQTLVAPLTTVIETLRPKPEEIRTLGPNARVVCIRNNYLPLLDLGVMMGWRDQPADPTEGVCLLVENEVGERAVLLVDGIQGQRQVVIKTLETNYQKVNLIAAATILGDGRVALILDIDAVIEEGRRVDRTNTVEAQFKLAS